MKKPVLITLFLSLFQFYAISQTDPKAPPPDLYQPSILIELFSSEGCSSCPVADAFMKEIMDISDSSKTPIYIVDYHVTIWDRSGWVDPFSDSAYTLRQQTYLFKKKLTAMYTPMLFINGSDKDIAGTDKKSVGIKLQENLQKPAEHFMRTSVSGVENEDSIAIGYRVWGNIDSMNLNIVLVQKEINNMVSAGENKDQILHHHNLAKKLITIPLKQNQGIVKMYANKYVNPQNFKLISFVQHQRSWRVYCADQLSFRK